MIIVGSLLLDMDRCCGSSSARKEEWSRAGSKVMLDTTTVYIVSQSHSLSLSLLMVILLLLLVYIHIFIQGWGRSCNCDTHLSLFRGGGDGGLGNIL